jgi:hypothetical protein
VLLLLYGQVPHEPGVATVFGQLRVGKQPKPAHNDNLGTTTDNQRGGRRRFLPRLKPRDSTPQNA